MASNKKVSCFLKAKRKLTEEKFKNRADLSG